MHNIIERLTGALTAMIVVSITLAMVAIVGS